MSVNPYCHYCCGQHRKVPDKLWHTQGMNITYICWTLTLLGAYCAAIKLFSSVPCSIKILNHDLEVLSQHLNIIFYLILYTLLYVFLPSLFPQFLSELIHLQMDTNSICFSILSFQTLFSISTSDNEWGTDNMWNVRQRLRYFWRHRHSSQTIYPQQILCGLPVNLSQFGKISSCKQHAKFYSFVTHYFLVFVWILHFMWLILPQIQFISKVKRNILVYLLCLKNQGKYLDVGIHCKIKRFNFVRILRSIFNPNLV